MKELTLEENIVFSDPKEILDQIKNVYEKLQSNGKTPNKILIFPI